MLWNNHKHNLNHGNLGINFLRYLQSEFKIHGVTRLVEMHSRNAELISKSRDGIQQSHIDLLAGLMLVDQLRLQLYENMNESEAFKSATEWIKQMLQHVQTREQNRDINGALHAIEDAFNRDESRFWNIKGNLPQPYPVCGYKTPDGIFANPGWVRDVLKAAGYNPKSEIIALGKRGDLEINLKGNEPSIVKKIEGKSRRVIGLTSLLKEESNPVSNPKSEEDIPPEKCPF